MLRVWNLQSINCKRKRGKKLGTFNAVGFTIFDIPGYFFFVGIGLVVSICTFIILVTEKRYPLPQNMRILFVSAICVILSARFFGCISGIYSNVGLGCDITWDGIKNTGIVFYGGLIGLLISYGILSKACKQDVYIMDVLAVCIPLFHSIARIGCFLGGCCFGKESHSHIAINYTTTIVSRVVTAYRIPIQLIEAGFNMVLFLYLFGLFRTKEWKSKNILQRYLFIYSVGRFIIEFFRGDLVRGVIYGISFSQVISVLIWIYLFITVRRKCDKKTMKEELVL